MGTITVWDTEKDRELELETGRKEKLDMRWERACDERHNEI